MTASHRKQELNLLQKRPRRRPKHGRRMRGATGEATQQLENARKPLSPINELNHLNGVDSPGSDSPDVGTTSDESALLGVQTS